MSATQVTLNEIMTAVRELTFDRFIIPAFALKAIPGYVVEVVPPVIPKNIFNRHMPNAKRGCRYTAMWLSTEAMPRLFPVVTKFAPGLLTRLSLHGSMQEMLNPLRKAVIWKFAKMTVAIRSASTLRSTTRSICCWTRLSQKES